MQFYASFAHGVPYCFFLLGTFLREAGMECIFYNSLHGKTFANQKYQILKVSSFIEIERGLFMNSSLVENMENQNFAHVSAQYTTESKNNQSGEYTCSIDSSFIFLGD